MDLLLAEVSAALPIFFLTSIRVAVTMASLPAPFGDVAPMRIRAVLSLLLAVVLTLPLVDRHPEMELSILAIGRGALGEVLVGAVIGLTARVTLAAAHVAGTLAGTAMGLGFAQSIDPTFGEESVATSHLIGLLGTLTFFAMNGHHIVLGALSASLTMAPPGEALGVLDLTPLIGMGATSVAHGLRIASPVVATMFVVQIGMALVSRAAPRLNLFAMTFAIAIAAGLLVLMVSAASVSRALSVEVGQLEGTLRTVLGI